MFCVQVDFSWSIRSRLDSAHYPMSTERSPLLENDSLHAQSEAPGEPLAVPTTKIPPGRLGPLEISASNRRSILAGIWMATFLSVRESVFIWSETVITMWLQSVNSESIQFCQLNTWECRLTWSAATLVATCASDTPIFLFWC